MGVAVGHLARIEANTGKAGNHLEKIEKSIGTMKEDIKSLKRDGIKTK
jgi:hypothetical protein